MTELLLRHWYVTAPLILLCAGFGLRFLAPAILLDRQFGAMSAALEALRGSSQADPDDVKIADPELSKLWSQYCATLQTEEPPDWKVLLGATESRSATVAAESIFCDTAVIDGRLHTEFFKHLPGLLTGLGIIGTFGGLIDGLGAAGADGVLRTEPLIASVREAFFISTSAIAAAMLATFLEKVLYARLHRRLTALCRQIDGLYDASFGEHYMPRLVRASEQAATNTGQINENLVGELRDFLLRLVERQKELGERQDARLQQLVATLQRPVETMSKRPERPVRPGAAPSADAMREQLSEFSDTLSQALSEQGAQARELHERMLKTLDAANEQMKRTLTELAERQIEASETLCELVKDLRMEMSSRPKPRTTLDGRRLTSGMALGLAETLAQMQTGRAAE